MYIAYLRGSSRQKWSKLSNFCFLLRKCLQVWGHYVPNFLGASGTRTPQKWGAKVFFFSFSIENKKRKWKKYVVHFVGNPSRIPKLFFFHASIKTEEVLFFLYIYIYIFIYLNIYKKLSPELKNFHEQKVFFFRFYILCENFSKIGPIIKKWGGGGVNGVHRGSKFDFFQCLFSFFIHLFI